MATVKIVTNISPVLKDITSNFELLKNKEYLLRPLAIETIPNMKERIHKNGQASDGGQIGSYSDGYMAEREKANRGEDRKVIVSLTRQLENDWAVVATTKGYAIGFNNSLNFQKAGWVEGNQKKIIFNLSSDEKQYITDRVQDLVNGIFG